MAYGYVGDTTWDTNSLLGIGAFGHTSKPGSLVDSYSAALTDSGAAKRGLKPGDVFTDQGRTLRYDDRQPGNSDYVDVYTPNRGPDAGVSSASIAHQAAIASKRPGATGLLESLPSGNGQNVVGGMIPPSSFNAFKVFLNDDNSKPSTTPSNTSGSTVSGTGTTFGTVSDTYPSWFKVATDQDTQDYDNYVKQGGDLTKIPVEDQLAVALKKDPRFLLRPENLDAFNEFVAKPQDASSPGPLQSALAAVTNIPGQLAGAANDAGKALLNFWNTDRDSADLLIKRATGWSATGRSTGELTAAKGQDLAGTAQGIGQLGADLQNALGGAALLGHMGANALLQASPASDEDKAGSARSLLESRQQYARDVFDASHYAQNVQQTVANLYRATGVASQTADAVEKAKVDPGIKDGVSQIAQIVGAEGIGAISAGALKAVRPMFSESALTAAEKFASSSGDAAVTKMGAAIDPSLTGVSQGAAEINAADQAHLTSVDAKVQANAADGGPLDLSKPLLQAGGTALTTVAKINSTLLNADWLAEKLSFGNPLVETALKHVAEPLLGLGAIHHFGIINTLAAGVGKVAAGATMENFGELLTAMGKEGFQATSNIPFWQRVASQTSGLPKSIALSLDKPLIYTLGDAAKGGAGGMVAGAAVGGATKPDDPLGGSIGGAGFGGAFGAVGGGFHQITSFGSPDSIKLGAMGDWKRYRDTLTPDAKTQFDQLDKRNQVAMGTFMAQYPGLKVNYFNDPNGVGGHHTTNPDGTSSIWLNTASSKQTIAPLLAHELGHQAAFSGILPDIYDALLGNPDTGRVGQYSQLGPDGKPTGVNPETGRFETNGTWDALKNEYISKLSGLKDEKGNTVDAAHLSDTQLAKEIYSEHQADYLLSGDHMVDTLTAANPYWTGRGAQIKENLMSVGAAVDRSGSIVKGAGIFDQGVEKNPELMGLAKNYYSTIRREGSLAPEEEATHKITNDNIRDPNVRATILDSAPEFMRGKDGNVVLDGNQPVIRTKGEVGKIASNMGAAMDRAVSQLPEDQKAAVNLQQTGKNTYSMRYMPDNVLEETLKENANNTTQANNLRLINKNLADTTKQGTEYNLFYHKALTTSKRYGQFSGQYRDATPYQIEKTKDGNINIKGVDFSQLTNNFLKYRNKEGIKDIWDGPSDFLPDAQTYFSNHANDLPGETNLGTTKRDAINLLTGVNKTGNPLKGEITGKLQPIIKSFRLDRINRVRESGIIRPFTDESQYRQMASNFAPLTSEEAAPNHPEAVQVPDGDKLGYGITRAPILGDKRIQLEKVGATSQVPQNIPPGMMDSQFKYLNETERRKLQVLSSNGSVQTYGEKIAQEMRDNWGDLADLKGSNVPDQWQSRFLRRVGYEGSTDGQPWRILPQSELPIGNLDHAFGDLAFNHAADKLKMKPGDLQAFAGALEKGHWEQRGWTDSEDAGKKEDMSPAKLNGPVESSPGYVYHATNVERLHDIAETGKLLTHKPNEFTDQDSWPDGSTAKRNYFTATAANTWQFAPEEGTPALLRMKQGDHPINKEMGTGDIYSTKPVPSKHLEYLGKDSQWYAVNGMKAVEPPVVKKTSLAQNQYDAIMSLASK